MKAIFSVRISGLLLLSLVCTVAPAFADAGPDDPMSSEDSAKEEAAYSSSAALNQFPQTEALPAASTPQGPPATELAGSDFPKVQTAADEALAKKFSWWPTDAKPAPVKDPDRSGYWWWPETPGEARPWGNQGFVYVRKIIFDYKSSEGEMKPSLVIKRVLKNVKILFDFDKSDLRDDAQGVLRQAAGTLERNPQADILITGNADRRGSEQHNLKLGERRADAVQRFMLEQGLPQDRIRILSRGKMDAMAPTHDLVGMQKDRNAQFMIAEVEEVMIPASKAHLFEDKSVIEEKEELESAVQVDVKEVTIQPGETLWAIAKREYGDGRQWKRIYEFNKDVISDPNKPKKGTKIKIPIE